MQGSAWPCLGRNTVLFGWETEVRRLNTGFLVVLVLPLPPGASVTQRQCALEASGSESAQDASRQDLVPTSCPGQALLGSGEVTVASKEGSRVLHGL